MIYMINSIDFFTNTQKSSIVLTMDGEMTAKYLHIRNFGIDAEMVEFFIKKITREHFIIIQEEFTVIYNEESLAANKLRI